MGSRVDWFEKELVAAFSAQEEDYEAFCARYELDMGNVYSAELYARYRNLGHRSTQEWALNTGGQL